MAKNKKRFTSAIFICFLLIFNLPISIFAQSSSDNYKIEEYYFGTGGEVDASSDNYRARQSTGSLGVGTTSSDNFDADTGSNIQSDPYLEMVVEDTAVNFGILDYGTTSYGSAQAGACNCSFYVKTYLSGDYAIYTISQPPTSENGDNLDGKTITGSPDITESVEEFGMNLVANSIYGGFGANRVNQPDDTFADGTAYGDGPGGNRDYDDPDEFAYGTGDMIAYSQATPGEPAVGLTEYTISYIAKPSIHTPAGFYQMDHEIVVVATF